MLDYAKGAVGLIQTGGWLAVAVLVGIALFFGAKRFMDKKYRFSIHVDVGPHTNK